MTASALRCCSRAVARGRRRAARPRKPTTRRRSAGGSASPGTSSTCARPSRTPSSTSSCEPTRRGAPRTPASIATGTSSSARCSTTRARRAAISSRPGITAAPGYSPICRPSTAPRPGCSTGFRALRRARARACAAHGHRPDEGPELRTLLPHPGASRPRPFALGRAAQGGRRAPHRARAGLRERRQTRQPGYLLRSGRRFRELHRNAARTGPARGRHRRRRGKRAGPPSRRRSATP